MLYINFVFPVKKKQLSYGSHYCKVLFTSFAQNMFTDLSVIVKSKRIEFKYFKMGFILTFWIKVCLRRCFMKKTIFLFPFSHRYLCSRFTSYKFIGFSKFLEMIWFTYISLLVCGKYTIKLYETFYVDRHQDQWGNYLIGRMQYRKT